MYGENGGVLRAELSALLRQHRIQQRIGGDGTRSTPVTITLDERRELGALIRRYRQSVLVWCQHAAVDLAPGASSVLRTPVTNPFRIPPPEHVPLTAMQLALTEAVEASSATLPTSAELTVPQGHPLMEHWRLAARAAALGEHDFDAGLGRGQLDAPQRQTLVGDIACVVQALVLLDKRYDQIPGWERLHRPTKLGWSALACALDAHLEPPDYSIDLRGWKPKTKLITGPAKPGLLGVLQAEHNLVLRMGTFPNALNLRLVVDSQRLLSGRLARLAEPVVPELSEVWKAREQTYADLQRELRSVAGKVGAGGLAATEGGNAVSRLQAVSAGADVDPRVLHGFAQLFQRLDGCIAATIEDGIARRAYCRRVLMPRLADNGGQMVAPPRERYVPIADTDHGTLRQLVRDCLRPVPQPAKPPRGADRSRAELHAALIRPPDRRCSGQARSL